MCSKIGFKVERSAKISECVYKACGGKIRTAFDLYNFIRYRLQRENKANVHSKVTTMRAIHADLKGFYLRPCLCQITVLVLGKKKRTYRQNLPTKKSLFFASLSNDEMSSLTSRECKLISPDEASQIALSRLSVEDLLHNTASSL